MANQTRLQAFGIWAEIVAALAVVVSLVFVGLEVRQGAEETALNTRSVQVSAYQDLTGQISALNELLIEHPDLARVRRHVLFEGEPLETPEDRDLFVSFVRLIIRHADMAFHQYQNGLIDEARLLSMLGPLRAEVLTNEIGREVWDGFGLGVGLPAELVEYVEALPPIRSEVRTAQGSDAAPPAESDR